MKHFFFEYGFIACLGLCAGLPEARTGYISVFYFFMFFLEAGRYYLCDFLGSTIESSGGHVRQPITGHIGHVTAILWPAVSPAVSTRRS